MFNVTFHHFQKDTSLVCLAKDFWRKKKFSLVRMEGCEVSESRLTLTSAKVLAVQDSRVSPRRTSLEERRCLQALLKRDPRRGKEGREPNTLGLITSGRPKEEQFLSRLSEDHIEESHDVAKPGSFVLRKHAERCFWFKVLRKCVHCKVLWGVGFRDQTSPEAASPTETIILRRRTLSCLLLPCSTFRPSVILCR